MTVEYREPLLAAKVSLSTRLRADRRDIARGGVALRAISCVLLLEQWLAPAVEAAALHAACRAVGHVLMDYT